MEAIRPLITGGLMAFHCHDSRRCWGPGFPDLEVAGPGGIIHREVKGTNGILRPDQRAWGRTLLAAGADWAVWYPRDLTSGRIRRELAALTTPRVPSPIAG